MFYPFFTNPVFIIQHRCGPSQYCTDKKEAVFLNSLDSLCFYGDTFQMEERYFLVNAAGIARRPAIRP